MARLYYDKDADLRALDDRRVAVVGYGIQGRAQALNLHDSGVDVVVAVRPGGESWNAAGGPGQTHTALDRFRDDLDRRRTQCDQAGLGVPERERKDRVAVVQRVHG